MLGSMESILSLKLTPLTVLVGVIVAMNLLAFAQFGIDKRRAVRGQWRIPEAKLLQSAFFGGYIGAKAGQAIFRHKTYKQPFAKYLNRVGVMGMFIISILAVPTSRDVVIEIAGFALSAISGETVQAADNAPRVVRLVNRF